MADVNREWSSVVPHEINGRTRRHMVRHSTFDLAHESAGADGRVYGLQNGWWVKAAAGEPFTVDLTDEDEFPARLPARVERVRK